MKLELAMSAQEVQDYVSGVFPQADQYPYQVERLSSGEISVGMAIDERHLRPGGTVSGPAMFALADFAAYFLVLAHVGKVALAVTTNLNINFLNKPEGDLLAEGKLLKLGKRLAVSDVAIYSKRSEKLVAHATATYSIPPRD